MAGHRPSALGAPGGTNLFGCMLRPWTSGCLGSCYYMSQTASMADKVPMAGRLICACSQQGRALDHAQHRCMTEVGAGTTPSTCRSALRSSAQAPGPTQCQPLGRQVQRKLRGCPGEAPLWLPSICRSQIQQAMACWASLECLACLRYSLCFGMLPHGLLQGHSALPAQSYPHITGLVTAGS